MALYGKTVQGLPTIQLSFYLLTNPASAAVRSPVPL